MASIRKRGNSYLVEVRRNGIVENKTFPIAAFKTDTRTDKAAEKAAEAAAKAWAAETENNILSARHNTTHNKTFGELLMKYRDEVTPTKRGSRWEEVRINMYLKDPIANINLREINSTHFVEWRDRRLQQVSEGSVLREWNIMSNALKRARDEWKWMTDNPIRTVKKPAIPEARDRTHTEEELERMIQCSDYRMDAPLKTKTQLALAGYLLSSETGLRAGELAALEWHEVFMDKGYLKVTGLKPGARKNAAAVRDIPLTTRAKEILQQIMLTSSQGSVFDVSQASLDTLFRKVRDRAGIEGLHYHDSRHVAITMLSKHYDVLALARIVGHKNIKELMTYYNPTIDDLVKHAP
jgi:integrase